MIAPQDHNTVVGIGQAADEPDLGVFHLSASGLSPQLPDGLHHVLDAEQVAVREEAAVRIQRQSAVDADALFLQERRALTALAKADVLDL